MTTPPAPITQNAVACFATNYGGMLKSVNQTFVATTGLSLRENCRKARQLVDSEDWHRIVRAFLASVRTGTRITETVRTATGQVLDLSLEAMECDGDGGFVLGTLSESASALAPSDGKGTASLRRGRFETLADIAPVGIFESDRSGQLVFVNDEWLRISGVPRHQAGTDLWTGNVHQDDLRKVLRTWNKAIKTAEPATLKFRWRHPDGSIVSNVVAVAPTIDEYGAVSGFMGVNLDITKLEVAVENADVTEELFSFLVNQSSDCIFLVNEDTTCSFASPGARQVFGIDPAVMIGRPALGRVHPDDRERIESLFARLIAGEMETGTAEYRTATTATPDRYDWVEASARLVRRTEGAPLQVLASLRNIDKRKELEAEIAKANAMAEANIESRMRFLTTMSHEIRTPMNGVLGFCELLSQSELDEVQRGQLNLIREAGNHMLSLLNDLLDLSRLESGAAVVESEPVDLHGVVASSTALTQPSLKAGVRLRTEIAGLPGAAMLNTRALRQMLGNLLHNAAKFTQSGEIVISGGIDGDGYLTIEVRDTGTGISCEALGKIFEPFEQADHSIHGRYGGSGLGLSIARNLARTMGGELTAQSVVGQGATFLFRVPFAAATLEEIPAPQTSVTPIPVGTRVLVVEDNPVNQILMRAIVERCGAEVDVAGDGLQGLEMLRAARENGSDYALVFMDLELPIMDGLQTARKARAEGFTMPIHALSAHSFDEHVQQCLAAGMTSHIAKPIQLADVETRLAQI